MRDHSDWIAESVNISMHNSSVLLPRGQSFCNKTDLLTALFLQLETRSPKGRNRRLPPGLEASKGNANPPWNLIGRVLAKVKKQGANVILIAPVWPSQPWYPKLLGLLVSCPLRIDPHQEEAMVAEQQPHVVPLLAVWPISGKTTLVRNFQGRLQTSYLHGDNNNLHNQTTPCAKNGSVSGPIEDVVNFLAHLFHDKYQYWSLNAYRSAIASMHTPVNQ